MDVLSRKFVKEEHVLACQSEGTMVGKFDLRQKRSAASVTRQQ